MLRKGDGSVNRCHDDAIAVRNGIEGKVVAGGLASLAKTARVNVFTRVSPAGRLRKSAVVEWDSWVVRARGRPE
jgi:hypothetical protein